MIHINRYFALAISVFVLASSSLPAQTQGPPTVAWNQYYWLTPGTWPGNTLSGATPDDNSGEDWFYDVIPSKQNGQPNGYLAAGYSTVPQSFNSSSPYGPGTPFPITNGCPLDQAGTLNNDLGNAKPDITAQTWDGVPNGDIDLFDVAIPDPNPSKGYALIQFGHENPLPKLALTDTNGNLLWYYAYAGAMSVIHDNLGNVISSSDDNIGFQADQTGTGNGNTGVGSGGRFYKAVQTSDGGYIAIGSSGPFVGCPFRSLSDNTSSKFVYNSTTGIDQIALCNLMNLKSIYVAKVDQYGIMQWQTIYGWNDLSDSYQDQGVGVSIANLPNGNCVITGVMKDGYSTWTPASKGAMFVAEINPSDGSIVENRSTNYLKSLYFNYSGLGLNEDESVGRSVIVNAASGTIYVSGYEGKYQSAVCTMCNPVVTKYNTTAYDNALVISIDESSFNNITHYYTSPPPLAQCPFSALPATPSSSNPGFCYEDQSASFGLTLDNTSTSGNVIAVIQSSTDCLLCGESGTGVGATGLFVALHSDLSVQAGPTAIDNQNNFEGYDLQMGITSTVDASGNPDGFAICGNKIDPNARAVFTHCKDGVTGADHNYGNFTNTFRFWNSDAYVVKYGTAANGYPQLWNRYISASTPLATAATEGNYDPGNGTYGNVGDPRTQGDIKRQLCVYKIIPGADPGSLVLCGNNSNNLDDDMLIKLNATNCQSTAAANCSTAPAVLLHFNTSNGLGGYYVNTTTTPGDTIFINSPTVWSTDGVVYGTVVVAPGATLNIQNCTLQFLDYLKTDDNNQNTYLVNPSNTLHPTKIVVQPGGQMLVDNATLEGLQPCGDTWYGIEVWGNSSAPQTPTSNQGYLSINNSVVRDMQWGIMAEKPTDLDHGLVDLSMNGGIINAQYSSFLENQRTFGFSQYTTDISSSFISNCAFSNMTLPPVSAISLWNHHGLQILGNTFTSNPLWPASVRGDAISSVDAEYLSGIVNNNLYANSFSGYYHGIFALGTSSSHFLNGSIAVESNTFTNCYRSIYMQGVDGAAINNCVIDDNSLSDPTNTGIYGIYLDGSNQISSNFCENNTLTGPSSSTSTPAGILVCQHGTMPQLIRNNTVTGFVAGLEAGGLNGSVSSTNSALSDGLNFLCSSLNNISSDILLAPYQGETGFLPTQGSCGGIITNGGSPTDNVTTPADDQFSSTQIENIYSAGTDFTYLYPQNGSTPGVFYPTNTVNVNVQECFGATVVLGTDCEVREKELVITPGLAFDSAFQHIKNITNAEAGLIARIDNGLTGYWKADLAAATPATIGPILDTIYQIDVLSSDVLASILNNPNASYALTQVDNILKKNSGLSAEVVDSLLAAQLPFSAGEIEDLAALQGGASPELSILSEVAALRTERREYKSQLSKDWIQEGRLNDLLNLLTGSESTDDKLILVNIDLNTGDTTGADALIADLARGHAVDDQTLGLLNLQNTQTKAGLSMNQLDTDQISYLQSIAYTYGSPAFLRAQALLSLNNITPYREYIPVIKGTKSLEKPTNKWKQMHTVQKQSMTLAPNPAATSVLVTVQLADNTADAQLQITDMMGQPMYSQPLQSSYNTIMVPLDRFSPGIYLCTTYQGGKAIFSSKLSVMKSE